MLNLVWHWSTKHCDLHFRVWKYVEGVGGLLCEWPPHSLLPTKKHPVPWLTPESRFGVVTAPYHWPRFPLFDDAGLHVLLCSGCVVAFMEEKRSRETWPKFRNRQRKAKAASPLCLHWFYHNSSVNSRHARWGPNSPALAFCYPLRRNEKSQNWEGSLAPKSKYNLSDGYWSLLG